MAKIIDGSTSFEAGMVSATDPIKVPENAYAWGVNVVNTGGIISPRPGYDWTATLPCGTLQEFTFFIPSRGLPKAIAFVDGQGYAASFPYTDFQPLPGVTMSPRADSVYTEMAVKVTERNPDGSTRVISPRRILMIQDGLSPASYYDGTSLKRAPGVPQGTWMKWTGSRLWVFRRAQAFAGDIGDPLTFKEQITNTLGGVQSYVLPGDVTGVAEVPGVADPAMLVFTADTTSIFQTNIRTRALWPDTPNFQRILFPTLGCVSGRSIAPQSGQLWWFAQSGVMRLDSAAMSFTTARTDIMDTEMLRSKAHLGDLSRVCAVSHQGLFLISVPFADKFNPHTWVLNTAAVDLLNQASPPGWCSVWTGIRPVKWATTGKSNGASLYVASKDFDGHNRIYRAFSNSQQDNGCDFPCAVELRGITGGNLSPKKIRHGNYLLAEIAGEVNMRVLWAGIARGKWKTLGSARLFSREDSVVNSSATIYDETSVLVSLRRQSRNLNTEDPDEDAEDAQTSGAVESPDSERVDNAFSVRLEWTGRASLRTYRQFMDPEAEDFNGGGKDADDSEENFVRADGAAGNTLSAVEEDVVPPQTSTKSVSVRYKNFAATGIATVESSISQEDADKRATQIASARANVKLLQIAPKYVGQGLV